MSRLFLRSLFGPTARRTPTVRPTGPALRVDPLEERAVPSAAGLDPSRLRVDPGSYDPSHILVRFREDPAVPRGRGEGAGIAHSLVSGLYRVDVGAGTTVEAAVAAYAARPDVLYAQPDYRLHLSLTPSDPRYGELWGMNNTGQTGGKVDADIDAAQAWDVTTGSRDTVVAVIDTGVDYTHPDLQANMWRNETEYLGTAGFDDDGNGFADDVFGYDFANNDADPKDDHYHGTHVAGTIAAVGNDQGLIGVAPGVRVMALKFLDASGYGTTSDAIRALEYAVKNGAQISNNSYGGEAVHEQAFADALEGARTAGHIFVAAAGNGDAFGVGLDNESRPHYPSNYPHDNVVAVAATDANDVLAGFSNFGRTSVDLAAPGVNILSTSPGNAYRTLSGTSMAAPHVSGALALVHGQHLADPNWSYRQTIDRVLGTADGLAGLDGKVVTGGRLDAGRAVGVDLGGPFVLNTTPSGNTAGPVATVRVSFNEAIDAATFTAADVGFQGPDPSVTVTGVTPVDGFNRRFDVTFSQPLDAGSYTLVIGPDILDAQGSRMDQDRDGTPGEATGDQYTARFAISNVVGSDAVYTGRTVPFRDLTAYMATGASTIASTGDERAYAVRPKDRFNFYGTEYATLYVSTNGLITFGSGNAASANTDLGTGPGQRAIAPLWDDWIKNSADVSRTGTAMMRYKLGDADGDGAKDLVIEWSQVKGYTTSPSYVTFQAVLQLNTGAKPGAITFVYPDQDSGDYRTDGGSATIGIKDTGANAANRIQVSYNAISSYVGSRKAIQFTPGAAPAGTGTTGVRSATLTTEETDAPAVPFLPALAPTGGFAGPAAGQPASAAGGNGYRSQPVDGGPLPVAVPATTEDGAIDPMTSPAGFGGLDAANLFSWEDDEQGV